ncbi:MAG TPA: spore cortex-lytic enzyme [Clostridiaceae bacterium]|nr:spore cortex-lytic enzyme [Clostridiaceae bacterium]
MAVKKFTVLLMTVLIVCFSCYTYINSPEAIIAVDYRWGSRGPTVVEIQRRLKNWGYYKGNLDGIYGVKTYSAVLNFQKKNGLSSDGVVGSRTLAALGINSGRASASSGNKDLYLLACAIHGEARGEPYTGQVAVGAVIVNRTRNPKFPSTVAGVIYQPGAFTAVTDGQINIPPGDTALKAAQDALNGWDPSGGAIYYYNPAKTTNKWIWSRPIVKVIGKHYFCK